MHKISKYKKGDIVWVESQGDPWWPGIVASEEVTKSLQEYNEKDGLGVLLMKETPNYHLVDETALLDFETNFEKIIKENDSEDLRAAVEMARKGSEELPPLILPPRRRRASIANICGESRPKRRQSVGKDKNKSIEKKVLEMVSSNEAALDEEAKAIEMPTENEFKDEEGDREVSTEEPKRPSESPDETRAPEDVVDKIQPSEALVEEDSLNVVKDEDAEECRTEETLERMEVENDVQKLEEPSADNKPVEAPLSEVQISDTLNEEIEKILVQEEPKGDSKPITKATMDGEELTAVSTVADACPENNEGNDLKNTKDIPEEVVDEGI